MQRWGAMRLTDVARARRDPALVVLEGFHAVKHAVRFGGELLGTWTADPAGLEALRARLAPDVELAPQLVGAAELAAVVPRAQVVAVARRPAQPDPDTLLDEPRRDADPAARPRVALDGGGEQVRGGGCDVGDAPVHAGQVGGDDLRDRMVVVAGVREVARDGEAVAAGRGVDAA